MSAHPRAGRSALPIVDRPGADGELHRCRACTGRGNSARRQAPGRMPAMTTEPELVRLRAPAPGSGRGRPESAVPVRRRPRLPVDRSGGWRPAAASDVPDPGRWRPGGASHSIGEARPTCTATAGTRCTRSRRDDNEDALYLTGRAAQVGDQESLALAASARFLAERGWTASRPDSRDGEFFQFRLSRCLLTRTDSHGDWNPRHTHLGRLGRISAWLTVTRGRCRASGPPAGRAADK